MTLMHSPLASLAATVGAATAAMERIGSALEGMGRLAHAIESARCVVGDDGISYAKRVARETVSDMGSALTQANALFMSGHGDHLAATAACTSCDLGEVYVHGRRVRSVGSDVAASYAAWSEPGAALELRTPPSVWTGAPPKQLFEPRGEP